MRNKILRKEDEWCFHKTTKQNKKKNTKHTKVLAAADILLMFSSLIHWC